MQKALVFGQMSEFLSTVIKSCCANFWGKVTSVSLTINFLAKMSVLFKKNEILGRDVDFSIKCPLLLKVIIFLQNMPIFRNISCLILVKNFNFLGYTILYMC